MREKPTVLIGLTVQVLLAFFLGHYYDMRVFMAAGYAVGSGLNPYEYHSLQGVFQHSLFQEAVPGIGYPPPWPLLMGLIYLLSFNLIPNLFLYNFAIKVPIIVGNIGLAYLVRWLLRYSGVNEEEARRSWLFFVFNPFIIFTTSAWGQFDTIVALLSLASLCFLHRGRLEWSATLLALAISMKPIALPLLPLALIYTGKNSPRRGLRYMAVFTPALLVFSAAPFLISGWSLDPILSNWNAHFNVAGGMSLFGLLEFLQGSYVVPESSQILGFVWLPALAVGAWLLRSDSRSFEALVQGATSLTLIFFLTRTWLSEPNVNLILPMILILTATGRLRRCSLLWVIPLIFTFLNTSFPQLFILPYPSTIALLADLDSRIRSARLITRTLVVIPWHILGWRIVVKNYVGAHQRSQGYRRSIEGTGSC